MLVASQMHSIIVIAKGGPILTGESSTNFNNAGDSRPHMNTPLSTVNK